MRRLLAPVVTTGLVAVLLVAGGGPPAHAEATVAADAFARTVTAGFGAADSGGPWTIEGTAARFGVSGGAGRITTTAGSQQSAYLGAVSVADVDAVATIALAARPAGGTAYESLLVRRTAATTYTGRLAVAASGAVSVQLMAGGTVLRSVPVPGLDATGAGVRLRVRATGSQPTTLRARAWAVGTTEPAGWQSEATDATAALQGAGSVGVRTYLSGSATATLVRSVDDVAVTELTGTPPPNTPPSATFTSTTDERTVTLDGTGSSDAEGAIASHAWDLGDGTTRSGATVTHTYAADGTYPVRLTVTDAAGATATTTRQVTVAATPPPAGSTIARDAFGRTVTGGLGTADVGGAWTASGPRHSVQDGAARLVSGAGEEVTAHLRGAVTLDTDASVAITLAARPAGNSTYAGLLVRTNGAAAYTGRIAVAPNGGVSVQTLAGTTVLGSAAVPGLVLTPGSAVRLRVEALGVSPTTVRARAWAAGTTEPATWPVSSTDATTALQQPGAVGLRTYTSRSVTNAPVAAGFDDLLVEQPSSGTAPPTAVLGATTSGLTVSVDGSASAGPAPVVAHAWDFGDGSTGTGASTTHTYAASGTYLVRLTVTDAAGATGTTTRSVTVTAGRPGQAQWLADVATAVEGATDYLDSQAGVTNPAIVLDIDNTALQSYYQLGSATPPVLAIAQRAVQRGYRVYVATGRTADAGGTINNLRDVGYQVDGLCFRDPAAPSIQASKIACREAWVAGGATIVANLGNNLTDLNGPSSGRTYLLPNYGFLD
ncbi:PKD domain-containing protein [Nocardioides dongxiaopingii]|uniref:PKD domain-containing protein n=1 Tax=Nocardioides dongxiaopingii TaxID=2576036 RepID=UPI0010C76894|nr:PKD domain-containing protein [Nocardioides dongxiaopingii]